jgi:hypothetical protein
MELICIGISKYRATFLFVGASINHIKELKRKLG